MKRTRIKLCGMVREADIEAVNRLKPDYIGFVFWPKSRRYVTPERAKELKRMLDPDIQAAGVFVDAETDFIAGLLESGVIDAAQLHGSEGNAEIRALKAKTDKPVIKTFQIRTKDDAEQAGKSEADMILLDSGAGSGEVFDWSVVQEIRRPFLLAGGLTPENVDRAIGQIHPWGVDVSSGIETDGFKDPEKMKEFVKKARKQEMTDMAESRGRFGVHGGQYIPETLMNAVIELEEAYLRYKDDPGFNMELSTLFNEYAGRPSRLYYAEKMTEALGGAKIYLKREDLNPALWLQHPNPKRCLHSKFTERLLCAKRHGGQRAVG